jgi:hypothetical protein
MKKPQTLAAKLSENRGQERGCLVLDQPQHLAKAWLSGIFHALRLVFDAAALRPLPVASASLLLLCPTSAHAQGGVPLWTNVYRGPSWGVAVLASIAVDRAENVFVTGTAENGKDYATIAYSNSGVPLWTNYYHGPGNNYDYPSAIATDMAIRMRRTAAMITLQSSIQTQAFHYGRTATTARETAVISRAPLRLTAAATCS